MRRILIVDDNGLLVSFLQTTLEKFNLGFVDTALDGRSAIEMLSSHRYDLCILDLKMPGVDGLRVLDVIRHRGIKTPAIILTGFPTVEHAVAAFKNGAQDFLAKPIDPMILVEAAETLLETIHPLPTRMAKRLDAFVSENFTNPTFCLRDIAEHFCVSTRYVSALFRNHLSSTFRGRLRHFRMEKAENLLRDTKLPIAAVALKCGFSDYRRLYDTFLRTNGSSPGQFRRFQANF